MRFALSFAILGLLLAAQAAHQSREAVGVWWLVVTIEAYLAVCLMVLALVYGLRRAGVPIEEWLEPRASSLLLHTVLLPYRILGRTVLYLIRQSGGEAALNPVAPGLYIGRLLFPSEGRLWEAAGITAVLNLCWEFPWFPAAARRPGFVAARVPILDGCPPTDRQFDEAIARVAAWRSEGRTILIHCAQGHGRSATVLAAALVHLGFAAGTEDALAAIVAARPHAIPSGEQQQALAQFLRGHRSA